MTVGAPKRRPLRSRGGGLDHGATRGARESAARSGLAPTPRVEPALGGAGVRDGRERMPSPDLAFERHGHVEEDGGGQLEDGVPRPIVDAAKQPYSRQLVQLIRDLVERHLAVQVVEAVRRAAAVLASPGASTPERLWRLDSGALAAIEADWRAIQGQGSGL